MNLKILFQGIVEASFTVVGGDRCVSIPTLDLEQLLNDVRWVLCNHAQSVADLVVETGIAKRENDVARLFF